MPKYSNTITKQINFDLLDQEMKAALPTVRGMSRARDTLTVFTHEPLTEGQQQTLLQVFRDHDHQQQTAQQASRLLRGQTLEEVSTRLVARFGQRSFEEIETILHNQIDSWGSLQDVQDDLKVWLPLLAAGLLWSLQEA